MMVVRLKVRKANIEKWPHRAAAGAENQARRLVSAPVVHAKNLAGRRLWSCST
jgi:hypothetical protein